jgi:glutamate--cysteine ligase
VFYKTYGYEDLELSTQILIKEALKRNLKVDVLDRKENFISISNNKKTEYVKQATKTGLDSYISFLIMENKLVTKNVLKKSNIRVPKGKIYVSFEEIISDYDNYKNKNIVIKPNSTNFGIGVNIIENLNSKEDFYEASKIAFENDKTVLVEEFIKGREYRFLVIGDDVEAVMYRVPANVTGDGEKSIKQLVEIKNQNPLRQKGYISPLEKIQLNKEEEIFLRQSNKDFNYIPKKNETVYLRENSNISTGGDSIDITDDVNSEYKKLAVKASKSVGAKICGADIIIKDINDIPNENNYSVIELNFNPALHIHTYPFKGKGREPAKKVLDLLGF